MNPTLAKTYFGQIDPTGWLVSEKLDGVRALWDGKRLVSRNGNPFPAPTDWLAKLPPIDLDGELWLGRGRFQETLSAVKRGDFSRLVFMAFDAPYHPGTFRERIEAVFDATAECPIADPVLHYPCRSREELHRRFFDVCENGGEGVMLRDPSMPYVQGRTPRLLKYKPEDSDEATVTGHQPGKGKFAGQLGALLCRWRGKIIALGAGLPDSLRIDPPAIGSRVTFGFCGLTDSGQPRFATFHAVRDYE